MPVGNRRHIPAAQKELLVTMSRNGMKPEEISRVTGTGFSTVKRVLRLHRTTGSVVKKPDIMGRPRLLNALDVAYLESCIERTPDIYISELQEELLEARGVEASDATIIRTLKRRGFVRKKVCYFIQLNNPFIDGSCHRSNMSRSLHLQSKGTSSEELNSKFALPRITNPSN
ncbi:hypothetical protein BDZ97DRAFT_1669451 [Flammula alnicola]|nr:hypothetical protein BDZ97DRAFT_1669451 [Flammula alnicola]